MGWFNKSDRAARKAEQDAKELMDALNSFGYDFWQARGELTLLCHSTDEHDIYVQNGWLQICPSGSTRSLHHAKYGDMTNLIGMLTEYVPYVDLTEPEQA